MKQNTLRIINSCGVAIAACGVGIYNTVHRGSSNSIDYQLKINYQAHPVASIIGSMMPGIIAGFAFYWWGGWRAGRKQKNLSSINPKETESLPSSNIDVNETETKRGWFDYFLYGEKGNRTTFPVSSRSQSPSIPLITKPKYSRLTYIITATFCGFVTFVTSLIIVAGMVNPEPLDEGSAVVIVIFSIMAILFGFGTYKCIKAIQN